MVFGGAIDSWGFKWAFTCLVLTLGRTARLNVGTHASHAIKQRGEYKSIPSFPETITHVIFRRFNDPCRTFRTTVCRQALIVKSFRLHRPVHAHGNYETETRLHVNGLQHTEKTINSYVFRALRYFPLSFEAIHDERCLIPTKEKVGV